MKKIFLGMLAVVSITGSLCAQRIYPGLRLPTTTEMIFDRPAPADMKFRFEFQLAAGNRMTIEFMKLNQLDSLPDLDELIGRVWKDLQPFSDSLNVPLVTKRVDYVTSPADVKVRIRLHRHPEDVFSIKNGEITQLKIEQDTLRIRLHTAGGQMFNGLMSYQPYFISFILNDISEVVSVLKKNNLEPALELMKTDARELDKKPMAQIFTKYHGVYDAGTVKRIYPVTKVVMEPRKKTSLIPYVQVGFQYVRGNWAGSSGVGLDLQRYWGTSSINHYRLYWEPYFFFSKDIQNKLVTELNSFVTFKFSFGTKFMGENQQQIEFNQSFSIGFLVQRSGEWFERNSIKFAVPGFQYRNVSLEPEFIFNKFFRNFSPSLKLSLYFE